eukprot:4598826-Alexandrium_andersonii.AAC.1
MPAGPRARKPALGVRDAARQSRASCGARRRTCFRRALLKQARGREEGGEGGEGAEETSPSAGRGRPRREWVARASETRG